MTRKTAIFEGWSWFKFKKFGLTLGMNLKFYTRLAKGLKLKVRKVLGLIPTFVEVTGEKLVGLEGGLFPPTLILNRVKLRILFISISQFQNFNVFNAWYYPLISFDTLKHLGYLYETCQLQEHISSKIK